MHVKKIILYLFLTIFMFGCSSSTPPAPVDSSNEKFAKDAISIEYTSSDKLNMYDNQSHTVLLVVYQLNDINSFNDLKKDKSGIIKLLEAKKFDKSVMSVDKYFIAPSDSKILSLDRASKTGWIGVVAGYYDMQASQSTLEYQTPEYTKMKFWKSESSQKHLAIKLYFDKSSLEQGEE